MESKQDVGTPMVFREPLRSTNDYVERILPFSIQWTYHRLKKEPEVLLFVRQVTLNVSYIWGMQTL